MQAMQWGMNPHAVAQKTHLVNGVLGYEAQLVNAVIASSKRHSWPLSLSLRRRLGALHQDSRGHRGKHGKTVNTMSPSVYEAGQMRTKSGYSSRSARFCAVNQKSPGGATLSLWSRHVILLLWVSNPKQQIAYLGVKYWARLYCRKSSGVYSPDEVEQRPEREINPAPAQRMSVRDHQRNRHHHQRAGFSSQY